MNKAKPWSGTCPLVLETLRQHGPMLASDIAAETGLTKRSICNAMKILTRSATKTPKRVYVQRWERRTEGEREYPRPVYAIGAKADAKRPDRKPMSEIRRDYVAKRVALRRSSSVFNLGMSFKMAERGQA